MLGWPFGIVLNPVHKLLLGPWFRSRKTPDPDPLYLIGKNVITQEDYDYLVRNYHRFAQIVASLCLPVVALAVALCRWYPWQYSAIIAFLSVPLWFLARRRYAEFHNRVDRFVKGRLCFIETQKKEAERKEKANNLVALAKAINEASRLLKLAKSGCCTTCKHRPDSCHALDDVIKELTKLLKCAQSCYASECKSALDSCGEALSQAVDKAKSHIKNLCPQCKSTLGCCDSALGDVEAKASELRELAKKCCCSKCPPPNRRQAAPAGQAPPAGQVPPAPPANPKQAGQTPPAGQAPAAGQAPPANPPTPANPATPGQPGPPDDQP